MGIIVLISLVGLVVLLAYVFLQSPAKPPTKKMQRTQSKPKKFPLGTDLHHWESMNEFGFDAVGETNYQKALRSLVGDHGERSPNFQCKALLVPEDDNPYDDKAIAVQIKGELVGYLSREDARSFRRRLGSKKLTGQTTSCDALIVGGYVMKDGQRASYGVKLDIKPFW